MKSTVWIILAELMTPSWLVESRKQERKVVMVWEMSLNSGTLRRCDSDQRAADAMKTCAKRTFLGVDVDKDGHMSLGRKSRRRKIAKETIGMMMNSRSVLLYEATMFPDEQPLA
jgi:hypothetical protein